MFYNEKGKNFIPLNIKELLTPRGLAYWYMDDGYKSPNGFYLSTESYSNDDIALLIDAFKTKFDLKCSAHKTTNGLRIYIFSESAIKFRNLLKPFVISHFKYKLS
jgi:hypothetical protein